MARRNKEVYSLGIGIEDPAHPGTKVTADTFIPYDKCGLNPNITDSELRPSIGAPGSRIVYRERAEPGGTLSGWAWPEGGLDELCDQHKEHSIHR
jgi:hypothetical protein